MSNYLVFDIGGTFIKYAVMDGETAVLEKTKIPTPPSDAKEEDFWNCLDPIVEQYRNQVEGIAVSMPGMIDDRTGFAKTAGFLKYMIGHQVGRDMRARYGLPVSIENDGKAAALAEHWKGALKGCTNCAVIIIGTGIGGGLILNDRLVVGKDLSAGEFSFLAVDERNTADQNGYWCRYGHLGLSELVAKRTGEEKDGLDGIEVFRRVRAGDADAVEALKEFTFGYAIQIYNLSVLLDLERIAIGGGVSEDPLLMDYLHDSIARFRSQLPFGPENSHLPIAEVVPCMFHSDANLIGALYHHLFGSWEK